MKIKNKKDKAIIFKKVAILLNNISYIGKSPVFELVFLNKNYLLNLCKITSPRFTLLL